MPKGTRKFGDFCWINMLTPKPAEARAFFGELLGWTYGEIPGMGHSIKVGGCDIGGLFDLEGPNTPPGTPPVIGAMVRVENADEIVDRVNTLGGRAMPAFDIMDKGRMAVLFDPNGAQFDVWQGRGSMGSDADSELHGAPCWFETMTSDTARGKDFYTALFGWTADDMPMPFGFYTTFKLNGEYVAGMMPILPQMGQVPSHWAVYFTSDDVDATAALAVKLGGNVCLAPHDIEGVGRFCGISSPQGVMFYVMKYVSM